MSQLSNQSKNNLLLHTQGVGTFKQPPTFLFVFLAFLFDFILISILFMLCIAVAGISMTPNWQILSIFIAFLFITILGLYFFIQLKFFHITLGEQVWHLKRIFIHHESNHEVFSLVQRKSLAISEWLASILVTTLMALIFTFEMHQCIFKTPFFETISYWKLSPFAAKIQESLELAKTPKQWWIMPIFYHIGTVPTTFRKHPIFYTIPYEQGPPKNFIGQIIVYLEEPETTLILEGPKTPEPNYSRAAIQECFAHNTTSTHCVAMKLNILWRHVREIEKKHPNHPFYPWLTLWKKSLQTDWTISWFQVDNPALLENDQAQGIYLHASGPAAGTRSETHPDTSPNMDHDTAQETRWVEDRFILINASGTQQTVILNRFNSTVGDEALALTLQFIGSLRGFTELDTGKAWVNRELESVHLNDLKNSDDSETWLMHLAEVQSLLISKISVDPSSYDSYFHLAGTSLLLLKSDQNKPGYWIKPQRTSAMHNLSTAYQFARDVLPNDFRNNQIEDMLNQSRQIMNPKPTTKKTD